MSQTHDSSTLDEASLRIDAAPEAVWDLVSDVTRMGDWSPECFRCVWIGRKQEPVQGARFIGFNRRRWVYWATANVVEEAERGRSFVFRTTTNGMRWGYRLEPDGDGTLITEVRDASARRKWISDPFAAVLLGGVEGHRQELCEGMLQTLERVKVTAEKAAAERG